MQGRAGRRVIEARIAFGGSPQVLDWVFPETLLEDFGLAPDLPRQRHLNELDPGVLAECEVLFTGWGQEFLDAERLQALPALRAVFHAGGTVKNLVNETFWERDILLVSAVEANARVVSEFTLAQIILGLKRALPLSREYCRRRGIDEAPHAAIPGSFGTRVGLIGCGEIGREVARLLKLLEVECFIFDPHLEPSDFDGLGSRVTEMQAIFEQAHVVSLHAPSIPETDGMVEGRHLRAMGPNATFINTSRGRLVNEREMIEVLEERPDLFAVLDVTEPDPPASDSPFYRLENVLLTPHIAGSMGPECGRLGRYVLTQWERWRQGEEPRGRVQLEDLEVRA